MSSLTYPPPSSVPTRKRTMSFSTPSVNKAARTPLRRTGSYLSLKDMDAAVETSLYGRSGPASATSTAYSCHAAPYARTVRPCNAQRERRKNLFHRASTLIPQHSVVSSLPAPTPPPSSPITLPRARTNSPLSPIQCTLPARASFPRSKPEPDLYRVAITTRMRMSPEGQKILNMGPRLALSIRIATRELERIVTTQRESDNDVVMADGDSPLSTSWVVVPVEDWEMVDRSA